VATEQFRGQSDLSADSHGPSLLVRQGGWGKRRIGENEFLLITIGGGRGAKTLDSYGFCVEGFSGRLKEEIRRKVWTRGADRKKGINVWAFRRDSCKKTEGNVCNTK